MSSFFDNDKKGVAVFLLIAFGLAWVLWEITIMIGPSARDPLFQLAILPGALSPAVAAIIVRKWVTREGFSDAGLRLNRHHWRYYLAALVLPLLVVTVIVLLATTLDISDPDFSLKRAIWQLGPPGTVAPPLPDGIFALVVFQSMIIALLATPILLGEEFGWRGYLQLRLLADRPLLAAVATGIIWSLWHLPLNLRGYNFPDQPIARNARLHCERHNAVDHLRLAPHEDRKHLVRQPRTFSYECNRRQSHAAPLHRRTQLDPRQLRRHPRMDTPRNPLRLDHPHGSTQSHLVTRSPFPLSHRSSSGVRTLTPERRSPRTRELRNPSREPNQ